MVTRVKALEAAKVLGLQITATPAEVHGAFRELAKAAHPDGGGSLEAFSRVEWAKEALTRWVKRNPPQLDDVNYAAAGEPCPPCGGKGYVVTRRSFGKGMRRQCIRCNGTGDDSFDGETSIPSRGD